MCEPVCGIGIDLSQLYCFNIHQYGTATLTPSKLQVNLENALFKRDQASMRAEIDRLNRLAQLLASRLKVKTMESETLRKQVQQYETEVHDAITFATITIKEELSRDIRAELEEEFRVRALRPPSDLTLSCPN